MILQKLLSWQRWSLLFLQLAILPRWLWISVSPETNSRSSSCSFGCGTALLNFDRSFRQVLRIDPSESFFDQLQADVS
jgi:hypothetical protein